MHTESDTEVIACTTTARSWSPVARGRPLLAKVRYRGDCPQLSTVAAGDKPTTSCKAPLVRSDLAARITSKAAGGGLQLFPEVSSCAKRLNVCDWRFRAREP